ncbi:hypothetical protein HMN09_00721200 [Mycena chlorophos]|uniref:RNA polymerase III RPC4-domain-containing protein n=1 Tax=Mycena chlorophos TaxID=658473 RepID=A0A8H6T0R7_MYCCL|nr:hypothetical protein HMN09_00721200 [Mycena chlorophos]
MADNASGSGAGPSKAIASLAKKPTDVTRQGTQKLKFTPVLPSARRKKEDASKPEPTPAAAPQSPVRGRGRGRGGDGRGRGRGGLRPPPEMTASGPFAMGPAMAGNTARRSIPRSNFSGPVPTVDRASLGAGLTRIGPPPVKKDLDSKGKGSTKQEPDPDEEVYSEPDEGVEIVDMEDVRQMDWMAPESLRRERRSVNKKKVKKEEPTDVTVDTAAAEVDAANALDLSESEEEEEYEDLIEHFAQQEPMADDSALREEKLYFFQFPSPFPTFTSPTPPAPASEPEAPETTGKHVSFADGVKLGAPAPAATPTPAPEAAPAKPPVLDGIIGDLEVYRSGAVKMRLQNGILLDVTAATQPSFLQHAVCLDIPEKRMVILGEVNKRFVVSPDIETLLTAMEVAERRPLTEDRQAT